MKNRSVIHCDMKPENVLFTDDSYTKIKIIDFGASCTCCAAGFTYVQSRYYRAPEIVLGLPYDQAVDMWSFGCIAYELITGSPLFPAHDENELLEFIVVTIGRLPKPMVEPCKKYKQFYKKTSSFLSSYNHELIRSKESTLPRSLKEGSQPIGVLLQNKTTNQKLLNLIEQCLILDPEKRITP